ncbi:MAG: winged helix-turn-helix domain-containing protein [Acidobacteriota bacterium]|nr:winged helix-turn-helix domain-containing protein [Acidobacteriota bacterium]
MSQQTKRLFEFGHFRLDVTECRLLRDGVPVPLKPKVLETLVVLVENSGHMLDKEELMRRLWPDSFVEEANLAVNISQLRKALGESENGGRYIETVPKRGYRFVAQVMEVITEPADLIVRERTRARIVIEEQETNEEEVDQDIHAGLVPSHATLASASAFPRVALAAGDPIKWFKQNRRLSVSIAATIVAAAAVSAYFISSRQNARTPTPVKPHSLAVLPFRNLRPNAETDFLGPSMADAIVTKLGHVRMLIVRPSSYVDKYRNQDVDPRAAANELSVDKLLMGSFLKDGDDLRITAQLINVSTSEILWRDTIDVKYEKLLAVQDRVAQQIVKGLQLNLSPAENERLKLDPPQNPLAYENFLRGRYLISTNDHAMAIKMLEESVALDPNYPLAWAYLGKAYSVSASQYFGGREFHHKAQAAYDKALALNPKQLETRVLLANFLTENNRVEEAVPILREVIEANPNHPFARWELSYAYRYAGMLDDSISEGESALRLYAHLTGHRFNSYLYAGQYEKFLNSLPMRDDAYTLFYRGLGNYYLKDWTSASLYFDRAYQLDSTAAVSQIGKTLALGIAGRNREGIELLKTAERRLDSGPPGDGEISYKLAQSYSVLGDRPSGLRLLRRSIEQGFFSYPYFTSDPLLGSLRGEAQYATLIEQARRRHGEFKRKFF